MWSYQQSTGRLTDASGAFIGIGYSGNGEDLDNPEDQQVHDHGPIPQGLWNIGEFFDDPVPVPSDGQIHKGPIVCHLVAQPGTLTYGRSGFMIHGDNEEANHTASDGCVILSRPVRIAIQQSGDQVLQVNP